MSRSRRSSPRSAGIGEGACAALSAAAPLLAELKFFGRQFSYDDALRLLEKVRTCRRPSEINRILKDFYDEKISDLLG